MIQINVKNISHHPLPDYATLFSSGMDIYAYIDNEFVMKPMERALISTGLYIELPPGYEAQIRPRSGLAIKNGITVLNTPGTIDADYRGEVKVILINLSDQNFTIHDGDRIAQMVIQKIERALWREVDEISDSERGGGGFGHTGK
ncbi:MAG: dUTP diphosphatase [Bacteroidales bacterium]|jgi:dUTP pyrophosphatase|nr:dUTP diphosphatase [Bacteroidales bacterium]MDI9575013.1 dUTP diphosphatase [Bacteroidota bacterium]HPZ74398.1 dUTP diphosphatase [Candidatus Pacearchaeota archaeon]MDD3755956.1 dUTP diphosphatase [Bacteroidales bacterium]MDY0401084.1 dUTP diphosphatase [Bacteroidales bacterium]